MAWVVTDVSVWQLADQGYEPQDCGCFILVTPDGENEVAEIIFETEEEAEKHAEAQGWRVVPLAVPEGDHGKHS